jgi:hypothetical protein
MIMLRALFLAFLFAVYPASAGTLSLIGAGPGAAVASCAPVSTPTGGIYSTGDFNDGNWAGSFLTPTYDSILSPACTNTAVTLVEGSVGSHYHQFFATITASVSSGAHSVSVYLNRVVGSRNGELFIQDGTFASYAAIGVNLSTCAISIAAQVGGAWTTATGSSVSTPVVGNTNGTYCKVTVGFTTVAPDTSINPAIYTLSGTSNAYTGDGTSSIGAWGMKIQ